MQLSPRDLGVDQLALRFQELIPLHVKVVFVPPSSSLPCNEVVFEIRVLNVDASISQHVEKADNEGSLTNCVGEGLNEIPTEPVDFKDGVVSDEELGREEHGEASEDVHASGYLLLFDLYVPDLKVV